MVVTACTFWVSSNSYRRLSVLAKWAELSTDSCVYVNTYRLSLWTWMLITDISAHSPTICIHLYCPYFSNKHTLSTKQRRKPCCFFNKKWFGMFTWLTYDLHREISIRFTLQSSQAVYPKHLCIYKIRFLLLWYVLKIKYIRKCFMT